LPPSLAPSESGVGVVRALLGPTQPAGESTTTNLAGVFVTTAEVALAGTPTPLGAQTATASLTPQAVDLAFTVPIALLTPTAPEVTSGTEDTVSSGTILGETAVAAAARAPVSPSSGTSDDLVADEGPADSTPEAATGFAPFSPGALDAAVRQVLRQIDDLGSDLSEALRDSGLSSWLVAAAVAAVALELARRRSRKAATPLALMAGGLAASIWLPGSDEA
jgi:hypothetical protein